MTFDERAYLDRLEAAAPSELPAFFRDPTPEQEQALRRYFGSERFGRIRRLVLLDTDRSLESRGHVVLLPGIMGSEISTESRTFRDRDKIWLNFLRLARGQIERLRLNSEGTREVDERYRGVPTGVMKRYYAEPMVALSEAWTVHAFPYDWRKDLISQAKRLKEMVEEWIPNDDRPVHFLAHSMGGLVVRMLSIEFPKVWERLGKRGGDDASGRLVMLGTPNRGSFSIPLVLCGAYKRIRQLACLDLKNDRRELLDVTNSFPGTYQLLPSPFYFGQGNRVFDSSTYRNVFISETHLKRAREVHQKLRNAESGDVSRFVYVAGYGQKTLTALHFDSRDGLHPRTPADSKRHGRTTEGDGQVTHDSGLFNTDMTTYFVDEVHGNLATNDSVIGALDELLRVGTTDRLPREMDHHVKRSAADGESLGSRSVWELREAREAEDRRILNDLVRSLRHAGPVDTSDTQLAPEQERAVSNVFGLGFIGGPQVEVQDAPSTPFARPRVRIQLAQGTIAAAHQLSALSDRTSDGGADASVSLPSEAEVNPEIPVDTLAVGHYTGVLPQTAEAALDRALRNGHRDGPSVGDGVLTRFAKRGLLRGDLGTPFMLPDPRDPNRLVMIVGMGLPGRFGAPELIQAVREALWTARELGRRHLATVLIGAGTGNLSIERAVASWLRGMSQALPSANEADNASRSSGPEEPAMTVTFVEINTEHLQKIDAAIQKTAEDFSDKIDVDYLQWGEEDLILVQSDEPKRKAPETASADEEPAQTRMTISREGDSFRFGAITHNAAIPEVDVNIDDRLVEEALQELVEAPTLPRQIENGQYVERLILPARLRSDLTSSAPVVLSLDRASARVHWEMFGLPGTDRNGDRLSLRIADTDTEVGEYFMGTARGLTRQLRTEHAPVLGASVAEDGVLRVLVIADPAEDARLTGADAEGAIVGDIFRQFAVLFPDAGFRVEIQSLIGPAEATRSKVMKALLLGRYDVVHYAGHCTFDPDDAMRSGWVFRNKPRELLTARELRRVDRVPRFIVSNACESGVTPDRAGERSADLAPSFAESFFAQGVANFVCTAWPIGDVAARRFATTLYSSLLGVHVDVEDGAMTRSGQPEPMYVAMRKARRAAARASGGMTTWGAYQHYGNPYFSLRELEDQG